MIEIIESKALYLIPYFFGPVKPPKRFNTDFHFQIEQLFAQMMGWA